MRSIRNLRSSAVLAAALGARNAFTAVGASASRRLSWRASSRRHVIRLLSALAAPKSKLKLLVEFRRALTRHLSSSAPAGDGLQRLAGEARSVATVSALAPAAPHTSRPAWRARLQSGRGSSSAPPSARCGQQLALDRLSDRAPQRQSRSPAPALQRFHRRLADAARRRVDHAQQRNRVVRILDRLSGSEIMSLISARS